MKTALNIDCDMNFRFLEVTISMINSDINGKTKFLGIDFNYGMKQKMVFCEKCMHVYNFM